MWPRECVEGVEQEVGVGARLKCADFSTRSRLAFEVGALLGGLGAPVEHLDREGASDVCAAQHRSEEDVEEEVSLRERTDGAGDRESRGESDDDGDFDGDGVRCDSEREGFFGEPRADDPLVERVDDAADERGMENHQAEVAGWKRQPPAQPVTKPVTEVGSCTAISASYR